MNTDQALLIVQRHQADLLATTGRILALSDGDPAQVQIELARARWQLARQLRAYQLFKHGEIFGPVVRFGPPQQARLATEAAAICTAHGEAFRLYLRRWTGQDILHDWATYRSSVRTLSAAIRQALAAERIAIVRLTQGSARLRSAWR